MKNLNDPNNPTLEARILDFLKTHDWATFAGLCRALEDRGDYNVMHSPNCVLWSDVSEELAQTLSPLLKSKQIHLHPAEVLAYFVAGKVLTLPIAKRSPKDRVKGFAQPRWLPVYLRPEAYGGGKHRIRGKRTRAAKASRSVPKRKQ